MKIRQFVKAMSEDEKEAGKMSFVASTDRADRYGDIKDRDWETKLVLIHFFLK